MSILTSAQSATLRRVLAVTNDVLPRIEMLEALGALSPDLRNKVAELRSQREYLNQLATAALEIDRGVGGTSVPSYTPPPPVSPPPYALAPGATLPGAPPSTIGPPGTAQMPYRIELGALVGEPKRQELAAMGRELYYDAGQQLWWYYGTLAEYTDWQRSRRPGII